LESWKDRREKVGPRVGVRLEEGQLDARLVELVGKTEPDELYLDISTTSRKAQFEIDRQQARKHASTLIFSSEKKSKKVLKIQFYF